LDAETVRVTIWLLPPGTLKGDAGEVVTPAGKSEIAIVTGSENPFWAVVETVKAELELFVSAVIVAGDTFMLKSLVAELAVPPAHPTRVDSHNAIQATNRGRQTVDPRSRNGNL
jgi:hypothetical protein